MPRTMGPYRIVSALGRGGMGVVYEAEHEVTGQRVALKTVTLQDAERLASVRREIQALAGIRHPGIVRIVDLGAALARHASCARPRPSRWA